MKALVACTAAVFLVGDDGTVCGFRMQSYSSRAVTVFQNHLTVYHAQRTHDLDKK